MKAIRAIKIIAFIAAIIMLLVATAGNVFIVKDKYDDKVSVADIQAELDSYDFKIKSLFKPLATANAEAETAEAPAENTDEATPSETPANTFIDESKVRPENEASGEYSISKHSNLVAALMKAGNAKTELKFLNGKNIPLVDTTCETFTVSTWLMISYLCLTFAFILHLISKKCHKTFYGILLMILGYLFFTAVLCCGQVAGNILSKFAESLLGDDLACARIYTIAGFTVFAILFGLPYVRCGSRQMTIKHLKSRLRKRPR
ncbi:MAG: hypothetical protein IKR85_11240 [Clostridia bacterium]|nr:hypothetical protein [Clostridia bacterium]